MWIFSWLYAIAIFLLAVYGFNILFLGALAVWHHLRGNQPRTASIPTEWPTVLVQLPFFNEGAVAERIIDAAAALDYPSDKLQIQILDDSTDECADLARARVAHYRSLGKPITYVHRPCRTGFKGGALAEGLQLDTSEFVAVFDADFVPAPDFLCRTLPTLLADPRLGLVQTRWGHLNPAQNILTRSQAIIFDSFFMVDQVARSRSNLMLCFNGSAGVWRRACIDAAGGWQGDTLTEDLDLSYRAHLAGWRLDYLPTVAVPAELTPSIIAFKRQQARWAKGTFQVIGKLGRAILTARNLSPVQKLEGFFYMGGYLPHLLMVISLLASLPVVLMNGRNPLHWSVLGLAGLGLPLAALWGQMTLHSDWLKRVWVYPMLVLIGIGLAVTNTCAIFEAAWGMNSEFVRTPKFSTRPLTAHHLTVDWTTWIELFLAGYALLTCWLAVDRAPELVPFTALYALGLGFTTLLSLWQSSSARLLTPKQETV